MQDRSFDAIARVSGFASSNAPALPVDLAKLAAQHRDAWTPTSWDLSVAEAATTKADFLDKLRGPGPRWVPGLEEMPGLVPQELGGWPSVGLLQA